MKEIASGAVTEDEIPISLRNRPVLVSEQMYWWIMYSELTGSRQFTSAGIAEIPYLVKVAWLDENGIDEPDDRRDYIQVCTALDRAYLSNYYEKRKVA